MSNVAALAALQVISRKQKAAMIPPPPISNATWIPLTQNRFALVDSGDAPRVEQWCWSVVERPGRSHYAMRRQNNKTIYLHRFLMDAPSGMDVDHINGIGFDCRRSNLRVCTHAENQRNYSKTTIPKSSRYKGVYRRRARGDWCASIKYKRKRRFLGSFDSEEAAARAYDYAALTIFGEFAKPNFK